MPGPAPHAEPSPHEAPQLDRGAAGWVAGVDGCRAGWVVVLRELASGERRARLVEHFAGLLALPERPAIIAADVPIGLAAQAEPGGRDCDAAARRQLGARGPSVFSAPARPALEAFRRGASYAEVCDANRGGRPGAPGLSRQAFAILPKIAEVDEALTPDVQRTVHEVHPELAFLVAAGGAPLVHPKKRRAGREERSRILERVGFPDAARLLGDRRPRGIAADDLLDAAIACWTAARIAAGHAQRLPAAPPSDARGLRMEIWA